MGGEVIIITADPDVRSNPDDPSVQPIPKVQVSQVQLSFSDAAAPAEVASAVHQVLQTAQNIREG